jgi:hypothetical protein
MRQPNQHGLVGHVPTSNATAISGGAYHSNFPSGIRFIHALTRPHIQTGSRVSPGKVTTVELSDRYIDEGSFTSGMSFNFRFSFAVLLKINRKPELLEPPVSHSKQRTGPLINRELLGTPSFCAKGASCR